jgi:hypothetical protein
MSLTKATYSMINGAPVNVLDYGAVGDGVANDTAAIQAAIDFAYANNRSLYIPGGTYNFTNLTISKIGVVDSAQGLHIFGDTTINSYSGRGTILKCNAVAGDAITVAPRISAGGAAAPCYLLLERLTVENVSCTGDGLVFDNTWFLKVRDCIFTGFVGNIANTTAAAVALKAVGAGGYSGTAEFSGCVFQTNTYGLKAYAVSGSGQVNAVKIANCYFFDHTTAAIQLGGFTAQNIQCRAFYITGCDFEGNVFDIYALAEANALSIIGNYFEYNTVTDSASIVTAFDGVNPTASCVTILGNYFQREVNATYSVITLSGGSNHFVRNNFSVHGDETDRYFLSATGATNVDAAIASSPSSVIPYPNLIGTSSPANSQTYTGYANTANFIGPVSVAYSASITLDTSSGKYFRITPSNATAFTLELPINNSLGDQITVEIKNTTGGALGTLSWAATGVAGWRLAGAWVQPATGKKRTITFYYDGGIWIELARTSADMDN